MLLYRAACLAGAGRITIAVNSYAATIAGFLGALAWPLDLCSHFRVQYGISLGIIALLMLVSRRRKMRVTTTIFSSLAAVNLCTILPLYFGRPIVSARSDRPFRVMLLNVNTSAGNPRRVVEVVGQINPDIVVLEEISSNWISHLLPLQANYPHRHSEPRDDNFGIILLSKFPIKQSQTLYIGQASLPSVLAEIQTPQGICSILATHPLPPLGGEYSHLRNEQLSAISHYIPHLPPPLILMGDLNTSPWSSCFTSLLRDSGLQDSTRGFGLQPSWPTYNVLARVPIDHCLHSPDIQVVSRKIGPNAGSDHFPLILDLQLATPKPK